MSDWIAVHTQNWPIFLTATTLFSVAGARLRARNQAGWTLSLFLGVWSGAVLALYLQLGVNRFSGYARHLWSAQIATLAVITVVPLLLAFVTLWLWMRRDGAANAWRSGAALASVVGAVAMTLAPTLSGWMFRLLQSWIAMDHRRR